MNETIADVTRRHDPDRFLTALFAPPARRDALLTLYAFDLELARAREVTSEPHLTMIRLHWWREVVEGAHRRHEVATPLSEMLDQGLLTPGDLLPVIDARELEAEPAFETLDAWRSWLLAGDGGIAVAAGRLLGAPDAEALRPIGAACGAVRVIRWRAALARRGRSLFPADLLRDAGSSPHDAIADPDSAAVTAVVQRLAEEARGFLAAARSVVVPREAIAAALPAVLARRDVRQAPHIPTTPRGLADRLAVTWAGFTGRI